MVYAYQGPSPIVFSCFVQILNLYYIQDEQIELLTLT